MKYNPLNIYNKLCDPAKFYVILTLISITIYVISMINMEEKLTFSSESETRVHNYTISGLIMKIIFAILWICLLNYICTFKNYGVKIAWIIVALPIILFFILMLILYLFIDDILKFHSQKFIKSRLSPNEVEKLNNTRLRKINNKKKNDNQNYKSE